MKICYVSKWVVVQDQRCLRYLARQGQYGIHLISCYGGKPPDIEGITSHHIPIPDPKLAFLVASIAVPLLIRKIKPDIVHGNYLLTGGLFAALARYNPLLQTVVGSDALIAPRENWLYSAMAKYALKRADLVWAVSHSIKRALVELGYPEERICVFSNGVDTHKFNADVDGSHVIHKLGWSDNKIVVCTRAHEPVYGLEYLIKAIPEAIARQKDVRFLFVGSGRLTNRLKQLATELGISEYAKFIGSVANDLMPQYLSASDIYVSPSLSDGTSVSLLEAMACALPVVVTDVDGNLEWVQDGINGFVTRKRDPTSLAQNICQLLQDNALRQSFGRRNYKIVTERAALDDSMKKLEHMYNLLVK